MIRKIIKFAWNVLNNEEGQIGELITAGGSILGGLLGGQKGPPAETTQRIEHVRPVLTPEEQAMQNFFMDQVYGRLGQTSPLQNLIEQYYGGGYQPMTMGAMPGRQPMMPTQISPEGTRQQYEQTVKAGRWEQEVLPALQNIKKLWGDRPLSAYPANIKGREPIHKAAQMVEAQKTLQNAAKQLGMTTDEVKNLYEEWKASPETVAQRYSPLSQALPTQPSPGATTPTRSATGGAFGYWREGVPSQYQAGAQTGQPFEQPQPSPDQPYTPLGAIMQQSPEQLGAQYGILRQQGMRGIEDWYQQAQREFERRGMGAYGGYMGTPMQQDLGNILAERGRMQTELGSQLGLSELQARQQLPYGQLQALEDVRRFEAQQQLAQQAPWIGVGQQMYALPWGQTTTAVQQQPGPGIIPGAISGAYTGAGLAQMGQNLGWWGGGGGGSLMTPGITNISATYGGSPSGYEGSMPGYGW
jgi:hypothetical protein